MKPFRSGNQRRLFHAAADDKASKGPPEVSQRFLADTEGKKPKVKHKIGKHTMKKGVLFAGT